MTRQQVGAKQGDATRCAPAPERSWGWSVQLYALRSRHSWGIGDLGDLRRLGAWAATQGAALLMVSPLHAAEPGVPQEPSPYYVSSRLFRNPLYIDIAAIPGARHDDVVAGLGARAQLLNAAAVIDRDAVLALKMAALEHLWTRFAAAGANQAFTTYVRNEGETLRAYATYGVLREEQRRPWTKWPRRFREPGGAAVAAFAAQRRRRIDFH